MTPSKGLSLCEKCYLHSVRYFKATRLNLPTLNAMHVKRISWALFVLLPLHASSAQLDKDTKNYFVTGLMKECFSAYRQAMGENISNIQIIKLCDCASHNTAAQMTSADFEPQSNMKAREKVVGLMQQHGTSCGYDILVPQSLK